jgi:hypothetical protein
MASAEARGFTKWKLRVPQEYSSKYKIIIIIIIIIILLQTSIK